jgi:PEP-CTERM motif
MSLSGAKSLAGFLLCCVAAGTAQAGTIVVNTFDSGQAPPPGGVGLNAPVGPTVANGVNALGVTFGFTENGLASTNATYGDTDIDTTGFQLSPLSSPLLLGNSDGVLTLTFAAPSTFLMFDIAFTDSSGLGGTVTINGTGNAFTATGNSGLDGLFSIGNFMWIPSSSFTQATIAFDNWPGGTQFAIDNLTYDEPSASGTPEPGTVGLLGGGMLAFGLIARKKRR